MKIVYKIYAVVSDDNLKEVVSISYGQKEMFNRNSLEALEYPNFRGFEFDFKAEHDSFEEAVKELERCKGHLSTMTITVLPIIKF